MNRTNIKQTALIALLGLCFFSLLTFVSCQKEDEDKKPDTSQNTNKPSNNQPTVKEETKYTVSYSTDFGVAPQSLTVKEGDKLTSGDLKSLDTDGYIFLGWYNGSNRVEEGFVVKQDLKLVAKWTKDGVVYANELKEFLAKKTDESKVYDITISDLNPDMDAVVKALKDNPKIKVNLNLENCTELKNLEIMPNGGISKSKAESFLKNLVSLTLPNGVINIVLGCDGLTSINIPNSVTTIEIYTETPPTIRNANAINPDCKIFVVKECVDAFKNADGWNTVAIQIKTIGGNYLYANELNAFMAKQTDESKIYDVIILDSNPDMDVIVKALIDNPKVKINLNLEGCTELKEIDFYEKEPENHATTTTDTDFEHPNNVGDGEYQQKETISKSLEVNGRLYNLSSITFPHFITTIALYGDGLISLDIPISVKHLHLDCSRLTSIDISNNVNYLSLHCNSLTSLNIPNNVTYLSLHCNSLTSLNIPNSVNNLTLGCNRLTSLIIPSSVALVDLTLEALTTLTIDRPNPPSIEWEEDININSNVTIHVPASTVETYRNANGWSKYANQILSDNSGDGEYHQTDGDAVIEDTSGSDDQQD
jgi:uncharacterized repeat protein (TIGR02543 family)